MRRLTLLLVAWTVFLLAGCGDRRPMNVLLLTLDTTRADYLGCYGRADASTPSLDRLASGGFLFERAASSHPVTQASHATILTGTWPMVHGIRDNLLFRLPEERSTLAEILKARGWATGAAVGGFPLVRSFGADQGFDFYDDDLTAARLDHRGLPVRRETQTWYDERPAGHVNDAILPWIRETVDEGRPFFAWLHYWDPHEPHIAPSPFDQLYAHDPYQGEIAYADRSFGAVVQALEDAGELDRTVIVVVGDHGEGRMDHNEATHAFLAYDTTVHVPLIIFAPGLAETAGRRIGTQAGTIDIVPTVLDLVGVPIPEDVQGRSLTPLMAEADAAGQESPVYYAESLSPRLSHGVGELRVLYSGPYKYIHGPRPELFHLGNDPGEIHDLAAELPEVRRRLERELQDFITGHADTEAAAAVHEVDDQTKRRLEALGYLSTTGDESAAVSETLTSEGAVPQDRVGDINLMSRLRQEFGAGRFHLAKATALKLLELDPENAYYRGRLAAAHLGLGQVLRAAEIVDATPTINTANDADFRTVAWALFNEDEVQRALAVAKRVLLESDSTANRITLASMLFESDRFDDSRRTLRPALEAEPDHRGARLLSARLLATAGETDEAEAAFRELMAEFPMDADSRLGHAELLRTLGRAEEGIEPIRRLLRITPGRCDIHLEHLRLLLAAGREAETGEALERMRRFCRDAGSRAEAERLVTREADEG